MFSSGGPTERIRGHGYTLLSLVCPSVLFPVGIGELCHLPSQCDSLYGKNSHQVDKCTGKFLHQKKKDENHFSYARVKKTRFLSHLF